MRHISNISKAPVTAQSGLQVLLDAILQITELLRSALYAAPWKAWTPGGGGGDDTGGGDGGGDGGIF